MWTFGAKSINWYEFDSSRVKTLGKHLRPYEQGEFRYQKYSGTLKVNQIQFFTTMARTAVLKKLTWYEEKFEVMSFWLRYARHFTMDKKMELRPGSTHYYKDADRTYWASRLGETYGYIEMERRGYKIIDHMENAVKRILPHVIITGGADYYCSGSGGKTAIAEFKGHIVNPSIKKDTEIKKELDKALKQCAKISKYISKGHAINSYAVATYIREFGDTSKEPSLIAVADPDVTGDGKDLTKEDLYESTLRGNYGTWLQMMGLHNTGINILRYNQYKNVGHLDLILINYKEKKYVFLMDECELNISYSIGINILFGLEEELFKQIIVAVVQGEQLSSLKAIVQLMKQENEDRMDSSEEFVKDKADSFEEQDVYIFNDNAIAISLSKFLDIDRRTIRWIPPLN